MLFQDTDPPHTSPSPSRPVSLLREGEAACPLVREIFNL